MTELYTLEEARFDIAILKDDVRWLKWMLAIGLTVIVALHFLDPVYHWGWLEFP